MTTQEKVEAAQLAYLEAIAGGMDPEARRPLYMAWVAAMQAEGAEALVKHKAAQITAGRDALAAEISCLGWHGAENYCAQEGTTPDTCQCYRAAAAVLLAAREAANG